MQSVLCTRDNECLRKGSSFLHVVIGKLPAFRGAEIVEASTRYSLPRSNNQSPETMLRLAFVALIVALIAGVLGFGGLAGAAVSVAKIAFMIFLVVAIVLFVLGRRVVT